MATVTSQLTRIHDVEGSLTLTSVGGGAGAAANTDIFIQATQSAGRRLSNVTLSGFLLDDGSPGIDLSAADIHVGLWMWVTHYGVLTALRARVASNSGTANYDEHIIPLTEYPSLGGWVRVWLDISRTPDATGGTALDETAVRHYGPIVSMPTVGGNAANVILDAVDYVATGSGLLLTGTSGVWQDFLTADEGNITNKYGVVYSLAEIIYCKARLVLGSASSLVFNDSGFTIVFPQQGIVNDTFMGISIDLQHASTNIDWSNGSVLCPGVKKADLLITGTSGDFNASTMTFSGLRIATLTSVCSITNSLFDGCGLITGAGANLSGSSVLMSTVAADASALNWDVATDPDGKLDSMTFSKGTNAHHAIEFGTTSPLTMTLNDCDFTGFSASQNNNASIFHIKRTTGTVTINLIGCTSDVSFNTSYRSDGATVAIVQNPVTFSVTVKDLDTGLAIENARVLVPVTDGVNFPYNASVTITSSGTTATVTHTTHGLATNDNVIIAGANQDEYNGAFQITVTGTNSYTYIMNGDPVDTATGTITSTMALLNGLTNVSGIITDSRTYSGNQPVSGWARKSTGSPLYRQAPVADTVSSASGLSVTVFLQPDE